MCLPWTIALLEILLGLPLLNRYNLHDDICDYDDDDDDDDDADDAADDDDNNGANCRLSCMQHHCFYHPRQQTVVDDGLAVLDWVKSELGDSAAQVHVQLYIPHMYIPCTYHTKHKTYFSLRFVLH